MHIDKLYMCMIRCVSTNFYVELNFLRNVVQYPFKSSLEILTTCPRQRNRSNVNIQYYIQVLAYAINLI